MNYVMDQMGQPGEGLRRLLDALRRSGQALVAVKLPDGTIIAVNHAAATLLGVEAEDSVGRHASVLFHGSDEVHSNIALAVLASGAVQSYTSRRRVRGREDADVWTCVKTFDVDGLAVAVGLAVEADEPPAPDLLDVELSSAHDDGGTIVASGDNPPWSSGAASEPGRGSVLSIMDGLSARERAIVAALLQGKRTATIAREMFISASTVRSHLSSIFRAFNVRSQADLVTLLRSPRNDR
jgi:PAS domain S-box-containing protein